MICVCEVVAEACYRSGLPASMLRVVRNSCVPPSQPAMDREELRASVGLSPEHEVLLTAAQFNECKGHTYLFQALPRVLQRHPRVRLILAGTGPREEELRRQACELGISGQVLFLGFRRDVRLWMQAADLLVLPSLTEGMSAVLMEAMYEGCPIVTTTVGGTMELLVPHSASDLLAWLIPPARVDLLAEAIIDALGDEKQRMERSARAARRVRRDYTVERMVANTLSVYRELIEGPGACGRLADLQWSGIPS
jgi:glycosyltransferase involved in cell wall biosynthesis